MDRFQYDLHERWSSNVKHNTLTVALISACMLGGLISAQAEKDSGGGKSTPLSMVSSSITNGETDVAPDREIKLVFSKNISNITVKENNLNCFSMTDSSGQPLPISVILFDDQLEREKRNDVVIQPEALRDPEKYSITVSTALTSKNGASLSEPIVVEFSTAGYKAPRPKHLILRLSVVGLLGMGFAFFITRRHAK